MWIGYPWDLRRIRNPKRGLTKQWLMPQVEHAALSGAIRTTSRRNTPRRWSLELPWIPAADADWLGVLARKLYGPGPFFVVEPSTRNYLAPHQSIGRGPTRQWDATSGTLAAQPDLSVLWSGGAAGAELRWVHPVWSRWPVAPGMTVAFRHAATGHTAGITFHTRAGAVISSITDGSGSVAGVAPTGAVWAAPKLVKAGTGTLTVPAACFAYEQSIGADWPAGEHCGAFSISSPETVIEKLPEASVTLDLLEQF
ncbi:hypothetical protein [Amycolatopsis thermophila]|uniref:Uncharacterized protein n=1 Tax=Amycolatopsis thermophila TaxID=206084 RepID=A0ABU0ERR1_9PSEU|nr:hypothetical protein [Amycolatopsis thermophila]MDQ0377967.1 hypothetical protein [Amycolatopsis thermophila]